jgi:hypothetical protein
MEDRRNKDAALRGIQAGMEAMETSESTELIRMLAEKWQNSVREKRKECDDYF